MRDDALSFVAGSCAGALGQLVGHPLDTLKVHAQTAQSSAAADWTVRKLFRGAAAPIATAGAIQSINLGVYESLRRRLVAMPSLENAPLTCHAISGSTAGLTISVVTCPLGRIKVAQQVTGAAFWPTARAAWSSGTLHAGASATALFEASRGLYLVVYVSLKRSLSARLAGATPATRAEPPAATPPLPLWARSAAGAGANVVTWGLMYPVDVVRSVQQAEAPVGRADVSGGGAGPSGGRAPRTRGLLECARALHAEGGAARLYRGFGPTLVRAGPVAGIILPTFEVTLAWLEGRRAD